MEHEPNPGNSKPSWPPLPLLVMCAVCLGLGFLAGYLLRGSASGPVALSAAAKAAAPSSPGMAVPADSSLADSPQRLDPSIERLHGSGCGRNHAVNPRRSL